MKRWSDFSHDHAELGAVLNGFSLTQSGELATSIEKTGQAIDATYMSTAKLLQDMEQLWTEPLHEYGQFANIIKKLLVYRHQKHAQYEMTQEALESKRESLEHLERNEAEARRLEQALTKASSSHLGRAKQPATSPTVSSEPDTGGSGSASEAALDSPVEETQTPITPPPPPHSAPPYGRRRGGSSYGFLSALSHSISGMMDVDPEVARRNNISKTRDTISQLEIAQQIVTQDLKFASSTIQADLDRFQRQKVADLREMALSMARIHRDWCQKNIEAWEAAKKEIEKIEDHPNKPPPGEELPSSPKRTPGPSMGGRTNSTVH
jgi:hypothetical protein